MSGWAVGRELKRNAGKKGYRHGKAQGKANRRAAVKAAKRRRPCDRSAKKYCGAGRGRIPGRVDIDERPKTVERRARVGNWEGAFVNGLKGTGNLVTLAERMTRFTLFAYAATKEADVGAVTGLLASLPNAQRPPAQAPRLAHAERGVCGTPPPAHAQRRIAPGRSLNLPAPGGGLRLAASRRPFGAGFASPPGAASPKGGISG